MRLLAQHIPPFVMQHLQPWKEALRNNMQGLPPEQQQALRTAIRTIPLAHEAAFQAWGEQFIALLSEAPDAMITRLHDLPEPPEEPPGLWQQLLKQAQQADVQGVAASLVLYNLGCARAVRQFKKQYR